MSKVVVSIAAAALLAILGFFALNGYVYTEKQGDPAPALSPRDATYVIEGRAVTLVGGISETEAAPGSASKVVTRYFGNEVTHDFDGDGREDTVFLLTQQTGGSGTFYYVVAALNKKEGYVGSQALFLGDRIAPQTTEMSQNSRQKDVLIVNYADRAPGESFSNRPSVGKSIWLLLNTETMQFGEVAQNFEGEADPLRMTLRMKIWIWASARYSDGREITPKQAGKFTLTFSDEKFAATTDCNRMSGGYKTDASAILFSDIASTQMYCEGSQESEFSAMLQRVRKYRFTSRGELVFELDSGSAIFR
jgi:heat shock protein HslJ